MGVGDGYAEEEEDDDDDDEDASFSVPSMALCDQLVEMARPDADTAHAHPYTSLLMTPRRHLPTALISLAAPTGWVKRRTSTLRLQCALGAAHQVKFKTNTRFWVNLHYDCYAKSFFLFSGHTHNFIYYKTLSIWW